MGLRTATRGLAWAVCGLAAAAVTAPPAPAQPPAPADAARSPQAVFRDAQDLIRDGRFDVAAETLKAFLAANPTDADLLAVTAAQPTAFLRLRNVPVWSENPAAQADAVKAVEEIIRRVEAANGKLYRDPARIDKFVRNLGATLEERVYAEDQLRRAGDAVVPVMVRTLRSTSDNDQRVGILLAVGRLGAETVPGFLAALDGLSDDLKVGVLRSLAGRPDALSLLSAADTDFRPTLWHLAGLKAAEKRPLREFAVAVLEQLTGTDLGRLRPVAELTRTAATFVRHEARYRTPPPVKLWTWDEAKQDVTATPVTTAQADEYFAVRCLRWALDLNPADATAQELFLTQTIDFAVRRAGYGEFANADPAAYQIAAAAPTATLAGLLDQAMAGGQTALALGVTQVLAVRADRVAVVGSATGRPGVLLRALDYPDPRVQLAAAVGVLRTAPAADHGRAARIVDVLRQAAAGTAAPGKETARALIADPVDMRGEKVARYLRRLGYATERYGSGRDLLRRVARSADYDLIVLDRHVADPELRDVVAQLKPAGGRATRPVLIVASADKPRPPSFEQLLLRLAILIAVTETSDVGVPPPYVIDPRRPPDQMAADRAAVRAARDVRLSELFDLRLARLHRLVEASGVPDFLSLRQRFDVRLPDLTYAVLAAEYGLSADNAPETFKRFDAVNRLVQANPAAVTLADLPTTGVARLSEQIDTALDPARRQQVEQLAARLPAESLKIAVVSGRDAEVEARLERMTRAYAGTAVIPEPFSLVGFSDEVAAATADPIPAGRAPAEVRAAAKVAVDWLRRLATGEIPGYDVRPAEGVLRQALRDDETADPAIDAVARFPSAEAQQDLVFLALSSARPLPLRLKAADAAIRHVQRYGKLVPDNQRAALADASAKEASPDLKARLLVILQSLSGKPADLSDLMLRYQPPLPRPQPAPTPAADQNPKPMND